LFRTSSTLSFNAFYRSTLIELLANIPLVKYYYRLEAPTFHHQALSYPFVARYLVFAGLDFLSFSRQAISSNSTQALRSLLSSFITNIHFVSIAQPQNDLTTLAETLQPIQVYAIINTSILKLKVMTWASGQQLQSGKYIIEEKIGEGGFGITYRAKDSSQRNVVIKTLNDTVQRRFDFTKFQQNFLNEAIKLAKCNHPHIARIDEVIQEGNLWCIVMEYIDGGDLGSWVENQGILPEVEALRYIQQIGEALIVVHNQGFLHRDIKPQNIMLRSGGKSESVLIDFGIAREFSQNMTQTHTQMLADGFAPIEQYEKRAKRGVYTDIYALAATLYSLLTGEVPTMSPIRAIGRPLVEPKEINPSISSIVNQAILKGMEVKAENRPQSIQEWLKLLGIEVFSRNYTSSSNPHSQTQKLISSQGIDYTKLQELLADKNWKAANLETGNIMLSIVCSKQGRWLDSESIKKISCEDLSIIDQQWSQYSNGHFGFSVQKDIWKNVNSNIDEFGNRVGWRIDNSWVQYAELNFNINAHKGHLPFHLDLLGFVWKPGWFGAYWDGDLSRIYSLISKFNECNI
jgi:eukaryotic-like serine/threonine-protein kinase